MSWNLRSRNTRAPESTSRRTRSGPAIVNSRLPTFSPPATPRTCSAMARARSAVSTSSATSSGLPELMGIDAYRFLDSREPVARHPRGEACQNLLNHSWSFVNERGIDLNERGSRSDSLVGVVRGENSADADDWNPFLKVAVERSAYGVRRRFQRRAAQPSALHRRTPGKRRTRHGGIRGNDTRCTTLYGCVD